MDRKSIEKFFLENDVYDDDHLPWVRNFFVILELIYSQKAYNLMVVDGFGIPNGVYTNPIKSGKDLYGNIKRRIIGAIGHFINVKSTKIGYQKAIFCMSVNDVKQKHVKK